MGIATASVVVLNASYEPLGVVPLGRAIDFRTRKRSTIVDDVPGLTVRSETGEFPVPRVVQFREMIRVPYRYGSVPWSRRGVLQRDGFECCYCDKRRATTVDHVQPRSRGGANSFMNTVASCSRCNNVKADRTPAEAGMAMRFQPRAVTKRDTILAGMAAAGIDLDALGLAVPA